jgi:hypothetical protein
MAAHRGRGSADRPIPIWLAKLRENPLLSGPIQVPASAPIGVRRGRKRRADSAFHRCPQLMCTGRMARIASAACGSALCRAYPPHRRRGRVAEGGGLLNRYRVVKPYRGFESLRLRHPASCPARADALRRTGPSHRREAGSPRQLKRNEAPALRRTHASNLL